MLVQFFFELRSAAACRSPCTEFLMLLEGLRGARRRSCRREDFYYLARACPGEGRAPLRSLRPRVCRDISPARRSCSTQLRRRAPRGLAASSSPSARSRKRRSAASSRSAAGSKLLETLRERLQEQQERHEGGNKWIGTGGTSPFGARRLQPRRHPHRPGRRLATAPRRQGLGRARIPQFRRHRRTRHAQSEAGAAQAAAFRARGRGRSAGPRRHHRCHGAQRRPARPAAACPSAATPSRCCCSWTSAARWTITYSVCEELFSAARSEFKHLEYFYFHNFLYERAVEGQSAPLQRDHRHLEAAAYLQFRLPRDLRRRCHHEPVRDHAAGRQCRALEQGSGARVDAADGAHFPRLVWLNPEPEDRWK